jgi:hypothetical protein
VKNSISKIICVGLFSTFASCNTSKNLKMSDLAVINHLEGTWKHITKKGFILETWKKENEQMYLGNSILYKGNDTIPLESIRIQKIKEQLFFIPRVSDQNDGKEVIFTCTSISSDKLVFENLSHDFPQIITYQLIHTDSLLATIEGNSKGKYRKEAFGMRREK